MKILAFNSGSSSIKYCLFDSDKNFLLLERGVAERIGQKSSSISRFKEDGSSYQEEIYLENHSQAMHALFFSENKMEINAVGHRIVHGGEEFKGPEKITRRIIEEIKKLAKLAPLHSEPNVIGIEILQDLLPHIPHVAVFDTSAHTTMHSKAFLYGICMELYEKYKIRKYGFHGINHSYVAYEAANLLSKPLEALKIITCHLGNGCSITAFEQGKSVDNSMGFTPLEGLVMGTRCGDIDPSVVLYLMEKFELTPNHIQDLLNRKSGLLGLCGKSDMRDIIEKANHGEKYAKMAIELFVYRIQKYIGAFIAALNGVDVLVFTGGIGENSPFIRSLILKNFDYLDVCVDNDKNDKNEKIFSCDNSYPFLMTIPANEEKVIAQQTYQLLFV